MSEVISEDRNFLGLSYDENLIEATEDTRCRVCSLLERNKPDEFSIYLAKLGTTLNRKIKEYLGEENTIEFIDNLVIAYRNIFHFIEDSGKEVELDFINKVLDGLNKLKRDNNNEKLNLIASKLNKWSSDENNNEDFKWIMYSLLDNEEYILWLNNKEKDSVFEHGLPDEFALYLDELRSSLRTNMSSFLKKEGGEENKIEENDRVEKMRRFYIGIYLHIKKTGEMVNMKSIEKYLKDISNSKNENISLIISSFLEAEGNTDKERVYINIYFLYRSNKKFKVNDPNSLRNVLNEIKGLDEKTLKLLKSRLSESNSSEEDFIKCLNSILHETKKSVFSRIVTDYSEPKEEIEEDILWLKYEKEIISEYSLKDIGSMKNKKAMLMEVKRGLKDFTIYLAHLGNFLNYAIRYASGKDEIFKNIFLAIQKTGKIVDLNNIKTLLKEIDKIDKKNLDKLNDILSKISKGEQVGVNDVCDWFERFMSLLWGVKVDILWLGHEENLDTDNEADNKHSKNLVDFGKFLDDRMMKIIKSRNTKKRESNRKTKKWNSVDNLAIFYKKLFEFAKANKNIFEFVDSEEDEEKKKKRDIDYIKEALVEIDKLTEKELKSINEGSEKSKKKPEGIVIPFLPERLHPEELAREEPKSNNESFNNFMRTLLDNDIGKELNISSTTNEDTNFSSYLESLKGWLIRQKPLKKQKIDIYKSRVEKLYVEIFNFIQDSGKIPRSGEIERFLENLKDLGEKTIESFVKRLNEINNPKEYPKGDSKEDESKNYDNLFAVFKDFIWNPLYLNYKKDYNSKSILTISDEEKEKIYNFSKEDENYEKKKKEYLAYLGEYLNYSIKKMRGDKKVNGESWVEENVFWNIYNFIEKSWKVVRLEEIDGILDEIKKSKEEVIRLFASELYRTSKIYENPWSNVNKTLDSILKEVKKKVEKWNEPESSENKKQEKERNSNPNPEDPKNFSVYLEELKKLIKQKNESKQDKNNNKNNQDISENKICSSIFCLIEKSWKKVDLTYLWETLDKFLGLTPNAIAKISLQLDKISASIDSSFDFKQVMDYVLYKVYSESWMKVTSEVSRKVLDIVDEVNLEIKRTKSAKVMRRLEFIDLSNKNKTFIIKNIHPDLIDSLLKFNIIFSKNFLEELVKISMWYKDVLYLVSGKKENETLPKDMNIKKFSANRKKYGDFIVKGLTTFISEWEKVNLDEFKNFIETTWENSPREFLN